jgi:hypothetical protein
MRRGREGKDGRWSKEMVGERNGEKIEREGVVKSE